MNAGSASRQANVRPWVALLLPPFAWYLFELGLGAALRASCSAAGGGLGAAWGCASLLACVLAGWLAWPLAKPADDRSPSHPWLARVALLGAGIYALAIAFQTIGTIIVPACVR